MVAAARFTRSGRRWRLSALLLVSMHVSEALAVQTPIGLSWRHEVFVQELWPDDRPQYCVVNQMDHDMVLEISERVSRDEYSPALAEWPVAANSYLCESAAAFADRRYLRFGVADGPQLGLLTAPDARLASAVQAEEPIFSVNGLNGSCQNMGLWVEQAQLTYRQSERFSFVLVAPRAVGQIQIRAGVDDGMPHRLAPLSARSDTLPIIIRDGDTWIDTASPQRESSAHRVTMQFEAPRVEAPTMMQLDARIYRGDGEQGCLVRGIVIVP